MKQFSNKQIIFGGVLFIVAVIISFVVFSIILPSSIKRLSTTSAPEKKDGKLLFDDSLPKTESCPTNGELFSKQQRDWWENHRPLGVMIENHVESRPQSGISSSDVVYEIVAEGGITRFLVIYYCQDAEVIGPVRSARTYFLDFISEYGDSPLYAHVGGANTPGPADSLSQIESYGWQAYNDLNQFSIGFPVFVRDYDRLGRTVATEHTMYASTTQLWDYAAEKRDLTEKNEDGDEWDEDFVEYTFKDDAKLDARPQNQKVSHTFWDGYGSYDVLWTYDKETNSYLRSNGGKPHIDLNNNEQLSAKNVVILYMRESRANDGYDNNLHLLYGTKGSGDAVVFLDGEEIEATWSKRNRTSRLTLKDNRGKEIEFNRGRIWFVVLPAINDSLEVN